MGGDLIDRESQTMEEGTDYKGCAAHPSPT